MNIDLDKLVTLIETRAHGRTVLAEAALTKDDGLPAAIHQTEAALHRHSAETLSLLASDIQFLADLGILS